MDRLLCRILVYVCTLYLIGLPGAHFAVSIGNFSMIACKYRTLWLDILMIYSYLLTCRVETEDCMQNVSIFLVRICGSQLIGRASGSVAKSRFPTSYSRSVVHTSC